MYYMWSVFNTANEIKDRPLIMIQPQAHKKLNPSLDVGLVKKYAMLFLNAFQTKPFLIATVIVLMATTKSML